MWVRMVRYKISDLQNIRACMNYIVFPSKGSGNIACTELSLNILTNANANGDAMVTTITLPVLSYRQARKVSCK